MSEVYVQRAVFAETWEVGGGMLLPPHVVDHDGQPSEYEDPRFDHGGWLKRMEEMSRKGIHLSTLWPGKRVYETNFELRERSVVISVTDWAPVHERESEVSNE